MTPGAGPMSGIEGTQGVERNWMGVVGREDQSADALWRRLQTLMQNFLPSVLSFNQSNLLECSTVMGGVTEENSRACGGNLAACRKQCVYSRYILET